MKKEDKNLLIDQFVEDIKNNAHFYLVDLTALDSVTTSDLRRACFKQGIRLVMAKNTLFGKALDKMEGDYPQLKEVLKGTTGVMYCDTANAPGKLIKDFGKKHNGMPALKAAYAEESVYIGADQLDTLVHIKSKKELIADVVAMLESPMQNVISCVESAPNTIHGLLDTLAEREG